jgi:hypothetical protein
MQNKLFNPITLQIYCPERRAEFNSYISREKQRLTFYFGLILCIMELMSIEEWRQWDRNNELAGHVMTSIAGPIIVFLSFKTVHLPRVTEYIFLVVMFIQTYGNIMLRIKQIKNNSYFQVNPTMMVPVSLAVYLVMSILAQNRRVACVASFLLFQVSLGFILYYVHGDN